MSNKKDIMKKLYENKYLDVDPQAKNSRVAPQTPWSKVLDIFWFIKQGDMYPAFEHKQITDIWGWLSNFAFELAPSVDKIILVDPTYQYDLKECVETQKEKAENRLLLTEKIQEEKRIDLTAVLSLEKEVCVGIEKWEKNIISPDPKIEFNSSFAQDIEWIPENSQDMVFFNFVLHTLQGKESLEEEIFAAITNAYRITKPWWKIYGIHDKVSKEDEIINALSRTDYKRNAWHKDNEKYTIFIIDKS